MGDLDKINAFFKGYTDADDLLEFKMASDDIGKRVPSISTGSHLLDDSLGCGGLPKGRITQYYGPPASGKTLMSMLAIKNAQKEDPNAKQLFIDSEGTYNVEWSETLGVDVSRVILVEGELAVNGRRLFEMLLGIPKEDKKHVLNGKSKNGLLDNIINKEININLIILDSLGQIIPPGESTLVGKMNISLLSRFITTTFRKLSLEVQKANVPFIVINHAKASMDMYGPDHTYSGGNAYSHSLSANVWFKAMARKDAQILNEKEDKIGHIMQATVEKTKFGPHPRKCEFKVDFSVGIINQFEEVSQLAEKYDVVSRPNAMMWEYGDLKFKGTGNFHKALEESTELQEEILLKVDAARELIREQKRNKNKEKISQTSDEHDIDTVSDDIADLLNQDASKKRGRKSKSE